MRKRNLLPILVAMLLVLSIGGVAYARYVTKINQPVQFQYKLTPNLMMETAEETDGKPVWKRVGNSVTLPFRVQCAQGDNSYRFYLYLVASCYVPESENSIQPTVTLTVGEDQYTGEMEQIQPNTGLYQQVGSGYVFRFYDEAGQEVLWNVGSIYGSSRSFTLTVSDMEADALLEVFAAEQR